MNDLQTTEEQLEDYQIENKNLNRQLVDMQIQCQENEQLNKTQTRLRGDIQKMKEEYNRLADEKDNVSNSKNEEIEKLKNDKDQLQEIIEELDHKLDEIAKQNELRDRLLEESIEKGKELEDLLHKKEQEVHRLVRDFEEEQSEKENQIHHLKATATNTIRNLYALNGLTGENIANTLDTQELKRSIGQTMGIKDSKKRVSFGGNKSRFASTLSRPGDRADINETIDVSRSQKLLSPYRKRTAAYTQATTKSSMKKRGKRDGSTHSAKKNRDTMLNPLGPSTPAKFTRAGRSEIDDDFDRDDDFEGDGQAYGIPNTITQIESNSALVMQLKQLLENAMGREQDLADFIEMLCRDHLGFLTKKFENLKSADMRIKENTERLLMRNEELETRLLDANSKLWTLKLLYNDYDKIIAEMSVQKEEKEDVHYEDKSEWMSAVDNFLKKEGVPRKKGTTVRSRSNLGTQKSRMSRMSSMRKKPSVRFQKSISRRSKASGSAMEAESRLKPKSSLLRRQSSRGNNVSLRKARSEAVRLSDNRSPTMGYDIDEGIGGASGEQEQYFARHPSASIQKSASIQPGFGGEMTPGMRSMRDEGIGGIQPISSDMRGGRDPSSGLQRSATMQPPGFGGQQRPQVHPNFVDQRSGQVQPGHYDQRNQDYDPSVSDEASIALHTNLRDQRNAVIQPSLMDQRSGGGHPSMRDERIGGSSMRDDRSIGIQPSIHGQRSAGIQPSLVDQRSGGIQPSIHDMRSAGIQPSLRDNSSPGSNPRISGGHPQMMGPSMKDIGFGGGHPNVDVRRNMEGQPGRGDQRSAGIQPSNRDQRSEGFGPGPNDFYEDEGMQADPVQQRNFGAQPSFHGQQTNEGNQANFGQNRGTRNAGGLSQHKSASFSALSPQHRGGQPGSAPPQGFRSQSTLPPRRMQSRGGRSQGMLVDSREHAGRIPEDDREYDHPDDYDDDLDELMDMEGEYDMEGEEEEEDIDAVDPHQVFEEAHEMIEDLRRKLKDSNGVNDANQQTIDSLRKELDEIQKINDRLENQLYKYQYDINRVTDVLLNDAYPSFEDLDGEEKEVPEMSDQERHLYTLLKRGAELRDKEKDNTEKLVVYEKDIEELMEKNKHFSEVEEIRKELKKSLENEKHRRSELESILDEKSMSFHAMVEEKEALLDSVTKIQAEKDELKTTLDTLHQLRDQEEEEIEKTLDEAKSIIQKLEEKLHTKDEKIKKYKEKLLQIEREKDDAERQLAGIEDDFKDREKNMKLKLLWAQMEKKDLATTILKLENSTHTIHQSEVKQREYEKSFDEKRRSSYSEEKTANKGDMRYKQDMKRNSENFYRGESLEDKRSDSRNRVSLRRKHVEPH